jgi:hypothetical protein
MDLSGVFPSLLEKKSQQQLPPCRPRNLWTWAMKGKYGAEFRPPAETWNVLELGNWKIPWKIPGDVIDVIIFPIFTRPEMAVFRSFEASRKRILPLLPALSLRKREGTNNHQTR